MRHFESVRTMGVRDSIHLMRVLVLLVFIYLPSMACAEPAPRPMPWVEIGRSFYSTIQVRMWGPDTLADPLPWTGTYIRVNVSDPYPSPALQPNQWYMADLSALGVGCLPGTVPCSPQSPGWIGADVIFLSGVGIISGGLSSEPAIPNLVVTFARADDATANCAKYISQTALGSAAGGGGVRSGASTFVPTTNAQYKFCFNRSTEGNWPDHPAYGINLTVEWWGIKK